MLFYDNLFGIIGLYITHMTNKKKILYFILICVSFLAFFSFGAWYGINKIAYYVPQPDDIDFSLFWDAYGVLQEKFIEPSKIDKQKIIYGAIQGMAGALDDPYTDFFNPEDASRFQQDLSGSFGGIGVEIGINQDVLTVVAPLKNTPGDRAGLRAGDIISKIDGKDSLNITAEEAVRIIRGTIGTPVVLTIVRKDWVLPKDITIIREKITIPSMDWSLKNNDEVAYIQIYQFGESLASDFKMTALQILKSPAKKIVLDLRNNPGGYLDIAVEIAGWFLEDGETIIIEDFGEGKDQITYRAEGNSALLNYPVVVLINQGSASASEILAGALRDNREVKLVGMKSFGKGSVQEVVSLRGGSFLKITIAKWLTPNGTSISDTGLEPDIEIEVTEDDINQEKDPQLEKALEIIDTIK
jgi:carboxyl-terminal processing protease